jgi:hypothetical protein
MPTTAADIVFDDCLAVLQERAKLFAGYRVEIRRRVAMIRAAYPERACFESAGAAFIERIGENIPDRAIKAGVKKLAAIEFGIASTSAGPAIEKGM